MPGLLTEARKQDLQQAEEQLVSELESRAQRQLKGVNGPDDVHVRDILPNEDLDADDANNDNGWNEDTREWIQSGLTADQLNQVYELDSTDRAEDKVVGIFAVSSIAADPITSEIVIEDGTGSRFERLMFQEAETFADGDIALFRNPIVFNEGKDAVVYQYPYQDGDEKLVYHGAVAEKAGTTLGTRSQSESAPTGTARNIERR